MMQYLLLFLEGLITFISPCLLPMLPVYVSYFAAGQPDKRRALSNALGFVLGFTAVFVALGAFAGTLGGWFNRYATLVNILTGLVVVLLGLHFMGVFDKVLNYIGINRIGTNRFGINRIGINRIGIVGIRLAGIRLAGIRLAGIRLANIGLSNIGLSNTKVINADARDHSTPPQAALPVNNLRFFSSVLFGFVFSIGWTPCVSVFLGSALMMASRQGHVMTGIIMLLVYSLGLGIPFVISALLLDRLKDAFGFIKRHYRVINIASGMLLVIVGFLMALGYWGRWLSLLAF